MLKLRDRKPLFSDKSAAKRRTILGCLFGSIGISALLFAVLTLNACAVRRSETWLEQVRKAGGYDVLVEVIPRRVISPAQSETADVYHDRPDQLDWPQNVVVFDVVRVLEGKLLAYHQRKPNLVKWIEAVGKHDWESVFTLRDLRRGEEVLVPKQELRVAVDNPSESFRIQSWQHPAKRPIRLYLQRILEQPDLYFLAGVEFHPHDR